MKKIFILLVFSFILGGCAPGTTTNQGTSPVVSDTKESETESILPTLEDGALSKYKVEFGESKKVKSDYADGDVLEVTYTFTNNSDEATSAIVALTFTAYQDGVQIDPIFDSGLTGDNESKNIKPGVSLECKSLFVLTSNNDVEIEAREFMGLDDNKTIKTYQLQ